MGREQEDLGVRVVPPNGAQHLEAVQPRHPNVQQGHVGLQVADLIEGVAAVARLADQLEVGALADGPHHPVAVDRMVVRNEDPHPIRPPSAQASSWITPVTDAIASSSCPAQANPTRRSWATRLKKVGAPCLGMDWHGAPRVNRVAGSSLIQLQRSTSAEDGCTHARQGPARAQSSGRTFLRMNRAPCDRWGDRSSDRMIGRSECPKGAADLSGIRRTRRVDQSAGQPALEVLEHGHRGVAAVERDHRCRRGGWPRRTGRGRRPGCGPRAAGPTSGRAGTRPGRCGRR